MTVVAMIRGKNILVDRSSFAIEFFLKVFTEFSEFSDKKIFIIKRARTCHFLCKRPGCYHRASKTRVREMIFKLSLIHASVIYQITEFNESSASFRKNSSLYDSVL